MQSLRSRMIIGLMRNRHLLSGKRERERADGNFSVSEFRGRIDRASEKMKLPRGVTSEKVTLNGIQGEWLLPEKRESEGILLYIHGGGFISGSILTHRMHVAKFARACAMKSLVFDYRLAPEHPFPAALEDSLSVYESLLDLGIAPEKIVIGGESAGATLVLSLLLALKEKNRPQPRRAFAVSPLTDFHCTAGSFARNARKDIAVLDSWHLWGDYYRNGHNPADPLLSPLFGDYSGTAPLLLMTGTDEVHYDDILALSRRIKEQGGEVVYSEWPRMVHAFPLMAPLFPEAVMAMGEIGSFSKC